MITDETLRKFLQKRGFDVTVTGENDHYQIELRTSRLKDLAGVVSSIGEHGQFVISVSPKDISELVLGDLPERVRTLALKCDELGDIMTRNTDFLMRTDDANQAQASNDVDTLRKDLTQVINRTEERLIDRIVELASSIEDVARELNDFRTRPWWKRFLGIN